MRWTMHVLTGNVRYQKAGKLGAADFNEALGKTSVGNATTMPQVIV